MRPLPGHIARALARGLSGWEVTDCRIALVEAGYRSGDQPPSQRGTLPTALDYRVLGRWGSEVTGQTATADLTRIDARLVAARLHDLQHQLPDLTGGEGVLEARFDGYQPVRGEAPVRRG